MTYIIYIIYMTLMDEEWWHFIQLFIWIVHARCMNCSSSARNNGWSPINDRWKLSCDRWKVSSSDHDDRQKFFYVKSSKSKLHFSFFFFRFSLPCLFWTLTLTFTTNQRLEPLCDLVASHYCLQAAIFNIL